MRSENGNADKSDCLPSELLKIVDSPAGPAQSPPLLQSNSPRGRLPEPSGPSRSSPVRPEVTIAGIRIDNVSQEETLSLIEESLDSTAPIFMIVVNAAKVAAAGSDENLRQAVARANLVTADGMSVVWASRLLGKPLKERVTGIDTFEKLVGRAARKGRSVYFLGAQDESVSGVVARFRDEYPELRVAGYRNGYFSHQETAAVAEEIKRSSADLLFVAMGSPRQDVWIASHLPATGARFALGVGGAFDHLSGRSRRAPGWMQKSGLEWLYRLMREPRRLWRRYLVGNSAFVWLVLKQLVTGGRIKPEIS